MKVKWNKIYTKTRKRQWARQRDWKKRAQDDKWQEDIVKIVEVHCKATLGLEVERFK